jgi:hypothetical protein
MGLYKEAVETLEEELKRLENKKPRRTVGGNIIKHAAACTTMGQIEEARR